MRLLSHIKAQIQSYFLNPWPRWTILGNPGAPRSDDSALSLNYEFLVSLGIRG